MSLLTFLLARECRMTATWGVTLGQQLSEQKAQP